MAFAQLRRRGEIRQRKRLGQAQVHGLGDAPQLMGLQRIAAPARCVRRAVGADQVHGERLGQTLHEERAGLAPVGQFEAQLLEQQAHPFVLAAGHVEKADGRRLAAEQLPGRLVDQRMRQVKVHHLEGIAVSGLPAHLVRQGRAGQVEVACLHLCRYPFAAQGSLLHDGRARQHHHQQWLGHRRNQHGFSDAAVPEQLQHDVRQLEVMRQRQRLARHVAPHRFGRNRRDVGRIDGGIDGGFGLVHELSVR